MPKKIQRDAAKAVKHAANLEKFGKIVKQKRGYVPVLKGDARHLELIWDFSEKASQEQVFILRINGHDYLISKQAWEHVARAI